MSKYKFVLAPKVRGFVEWQLERYHEDKKQLELYKTDMIPSATASYSLTGGVSNGSVSNPTENIGLKMLTNPYILSTERSCLAIERVLCKLNETDKQLIDLVYWKRAYTIVGAGDKIGLSQRAVYQHINNVLGLIALEMGLVNI